MELWSGYPHPQRRPWPSPTAKDANECARRNAQIYTPTPSSGAGRAGVGIQRLLDCFPRRGAVAMNENDGAPPDDDTNEREKREPAGGGGGKVAGRGPGLAQGPAGQHIGGRGIDKSIGPAGRNDGCRRARVQDNFSESTPCTRTDSLLA